MKDQNDKPQTRPRCSNCFSDDPKRRELVSVPESERRPNGPLWEECKAAFHDQTQSDFNPSA